MTMPRRRVVHVLVTREEAEKMSHDRHPQTDAPNTNALRNSPHRMHRKLR
jgi:hypothetical protein